MQVELRIPGESFSCNANHDVSPGIWSGVIENSLIQQAQNVPLPFTPTESARKANCAILYVRKRREEFFHFRHGDVSPGISPFDKFLPKTLVQVAANQILGKKQFATLLQCLVYFRRCLCLFSFSTEPSDSSEHRLEQHDIEFHCVWYAGGINRFVLNKVRHSAILVQLRGALARKIDVRRHDASALQGHPKRQAAIPASKFQRGALRDVLGRMTEPKIQSCRPIAYIPLDEFSNIGWGKLHLDRLRDCAHTVLSRLS